jgi:hypothetical protein
LTLIYIGVDDTDNHESRGTGRLARSIAQILGRSFQIAGVTRHQLLVDPRVPCTSHNSCAAVHVRADGDIDLVALADDVQGLMLADYQLGSDPGLCVARTVTPAMSEFGRRAKVELVTQDEAYAVAQAAGCVLRGLAGTRDGVIGALAAVGLAASGQDGRFLLVGTMRELAGVQPLGVVLAAGISEVRQMDGRRLEAGLIDTCGGKLRPALRSGRAILYVQRQADEQPWQPVKLD